MQSIECPLCWIEAHAQGNPDGASEVDEWLGTATCVRDNLMEIEGEVGGFCGEAAYVLAHLIDGTVVLGSYQFGGKPSEFENPHYWVEKKGYVIDPTAEQYGDFEGPIVTKTGDKHYVYTEDTFRDDPSEVRRLLEKGFIDPAISMGVIEELLKANCTAGIGLARARARAPGNPDGNPDLMRVPSFAIPPTYRTPKTRFYFLAIDHILKAVTLGRQSIARLEILRERAEGEELEKINNIISNIKEIDKELIEMKSSMERRGEQPTHRPMRIMDTADLDRRTKTETLITVAWRPLRNSCYFLERGKGNLRGLRSRLLEMGETEEARNVKREIGQLTEIGTELYEKQIQIRELKLNE